MTHVYHRITKRHVNVVVVIAGLAIVRSILLSGLSHTMRGGVNAATMAVPAAAAAVQSSDPFAPCVPAAANAIACENSKPGTSSGQWDIFGAGDPSIQGFATEISVNR